MSDGQRDVIAFLSTPVAYGLRAGSVERIDTHISIVWLAGDRVYKLQDTLFDRLAERHQLDISSMDGLAEAIVRLHARAEPRADHGGREGWPAEVLLAANDEAPTLVHSLQGLSGITVSSTINGR